MSKMMSTQDLRRALRLCGDPYVCCGACPVSGEAEGYGTDRCQERLREAARRRLESLDTLNGQYAARNQELADELEKRKAELNRLRRDQGLDMDATPPTSAAEPLPEKAGRRGGGLRQWFARKT